MILTLEQLKQIEDALNLFDESVGDIATASIEELKKENLTEELVDAYYHIHYLMNEMAHTLEDCLSNLDRAIEND